MLSQLEREWEKKNSIFDQLQTTNVAFCIVNLDNQKNSLSKLLYKVLKA